MFVFVSVFVFVSIFVFVFVRLYMQFFPRFWLDIQLLLPTDSSATPLGALTLNGSHTHKDAERERTFKITSDLDEKCCRFLVFAIFSHTFVI